MALSFLSLPAIADVSQSIQGFLSADEITSELFGVSMAGVAGVSDDPWSECIEPDGDTVYNYAGVQRIGKMSVREDGMVCFRYDDENGVSSNCFMVSRIAGDGYVFSADVDGGSLFRTLTVTRNVSACPKGPGSLS